MRKAIWIEPSPDVVLDEEHVPFLEDLPTSTARVTGELDVAGPELAAAVAPLIDEYRLA